MESKKWFSTKWGLIPSSWEGYLLSLIFMAVVVSIGYVFFVAMPDLDQGVALAYFLIAETIATIIFLSIALKKI